MEGREDEVVAVAVDETVRLSKGEVHYRLERPTHMNPHLSDDEGGVPVVICVHGIDHVARVWDFLAHHLVVQLGYAVLTFDLYDRGGSKLDDPSHERHSADLFVDQVRELWAKVVVQSDDNQASGDHLPPLRTGGFTLVGHSMGGAVSLLVAHRYPDLVEKLLLIGPAGMKFSVPLEMQLMRLPALGPLLFQWFAKQDDMMKEDFMDLEASKSAIAHVMEHTRGMYGTYAFACAFINSFTNFPLRDLEEVIAEVGQHARPSLVMWGEHDRLISRKDWLPRFEEAFGVGRVANHQSAVIADTKHSAFLERPDEAHRIIADFLRGTDHQHDTNDHGTSKNEDEDENEKENEGEDDRTQRAVDE